MNALASTTSAIVIVTVVSEAGGHLVAVAVAAATAAAAAADRSAEDGTETANVSEIGPGLDLAIVIMTAGGMIAAETGVETVIGTIIVVVVVETPGLRPVDAHAVVDHVPMAETALESERDRDLGPDHTREDTRALDPEDADGHDLGAHRELDELRLPGVHLLLLILIVMSLQLATAASRLDAESGPQSVNRDHGFQILTGTCLCPSETLIVLGKQA